MIKSKLHSAGGETFFFGEFDRNLDAQNRIALPSEWRTDGELHLLLLPRGRELLLFPFALFQQFLAMAGRRAFTDQKLQVALEQIGRVARDCRCDRQGRIKFDRPTLDNAGIAEQLKLVGALTHIKISSPKVLAQAPNLELTDCLATLQKLTAINSNAATLPGGN